MLRGEQGGSREVGGKEMPAASDCALRSVLRAMGMTPISLFARYAGFAAGRPFFAANNWSYHRPTSPDLVNACLDLLI